MGRGIVDIIDDACNRDRHNTRDGLNDQALKENEDGVGQEDAQAEAGNSSGGSPGWWRWGCGRARIVWFGTGAGYTARRRWWCGLEAADQL
jgi:hypothetical protein